MLGRIHGWILEHDESRLFIVLYIGLAVVLSIWLGLFWLCAVVAVHGLFETLKQRHAFPQAGSVTARVLWELKLDLALILFAFVITLYMDFVVGVVGLGAAARAGVHGSTRFVIWQKVLRGILLSIDDVAQVARAVTVRSGGTDSPTSLLETQEPEPRDGRLPAHHQSGCWTAPWSRGALVTVAFGGLCAFLLLAAPWLTDHGSEGVLAKLMSDLRPFPG